MFKSLHSFFKFTFHNAPKLSANQVVFKRKKPSAERLTSKAFMLLLNSQKLRLTTEEAESIKLHALLHQSRGTHFKIRY